MKTIDEDSIAARLRLERTRLKLSQAELADAGGVSTPSQIGYEQGTRTPVLDYLKGVVTVGVDPLFVLTGVPLRVASGEGLDWNLLAKIDEGIHAWCDENEIEIARGEWGELRKLLYLRFAPVRRVDPNELKSALKLVA